MTTLFPRRLIIWEMGLCIKKLLSRLEGMYKNFTIRGCEDREDVIPGGYLNRVKNTSRMYYRM